MNDGLKKIVFTLSAVLIFCSTGWTQAGIIYFQSENNTPFYLKIKDSIRSSNANGYLILHGLSEKNPTIVIGLAKKEVPEAAFHLQLNESGTNGYLLKTLSDKLTLENMQNKKMISPVKMASAAGNRIKDISKKNTSSEMPIPVEEEKIAEDLTKDTLPALVGNVQNNKESEKKKEPVQYTFASMLNAVTGGDENSQEKEEKPSKLLDKSEEKTAQKESKSIEDKEEEMTVPSDDKKIVVDSLLVKNKDFKSPNNPLKDSSTKKVEEKLVINNSPAKKESVGVFDRLLRKEKNENTSETPAQPKAVMPSPKEKEKNIPAVTDKKEELTFLDFNNLTGEPKQEQGVGKSEQIGKGKERGRKSEKTMVKEKDRINFNDLLNKIDTTTDADSKRSVAHPFLSKDSDNSKAVVCNHTVNTKEFDKIRRKIASKTGGSNMLRVAGRYFSENKCFTVGQIKELSYLFPLEQDRLAFLKEAYSHCVNRSRFEEVLQTLSNKEDRETLKAYIR